MGLLDRFDRLGDSFKRLSKGINEKPELQEKIRKSVEQAFDYDKRVRDRTAKS